ncbi:MAG TPA: hypothetical protein DIT28_19425, partial [Oxalobacteraceae bacterium]|nr:hypothetical protein [Oxalobacteraceae bacterium]
MKTHADKSKSASVKKQKKRLDRRWSVLPLLIAGCLEYGAALGNPVGPQVVSGQASMTSQGKLLTITNSPDAIINWQNFSIGADEVTRFIQQSSSSAVLNRIVGQDPSQVLGALQSNGRVFLINPNGILFGRGAQVDVNGLVASTLDLGNKDFLAGKLNFKAGANPGTLDNQGAITTPTGGRVYLIAPHIENSGIITSPKGDVLLAAGRSVQLVDSSNPDLRVVVSAPDDQAINLGQVIAQGGRIGIYGALVNQRGTVNADSAVVGENGKIVFKASRDTLLETGSVTSATGAGKGGEIQILGDRVGLTGDAKVDASGLSGGGTVLVGGDYHGGNASIQNATQTFAGRDTAIKTDALQSGEGGKIIVWSNQATRAYGSLSARGGALGGHGGFVETSGHYLDVAGIAVDTSAPKGKLGSWLLDPYDIAVAAGGSAALADVSLFATPPSSGTSTIDPALISGANSDVALQATHDITFTDAVSIAAANVGLNARAGNNINVNNTMTSNGGAILLFANDSGGPSTGTGTVTTAGAIASNGGGIGLSGHSLYIGNSVTSTNGMIDMKSDDFIAFHGGAVDAGAGNLTLLAGAQIDVWSGSSLIANQLKMTAVDGITDGSGAAAFTRVSALNVGNSGAGDIRIDNSTGGNLSIIDIGGTGYGIQQASSGLVDILNLGGTISGSGVVSAGSLGLHAAGGIALQTKVSSLSAINYTSGDINITNSIPLTLNDVKQLAEVGVNSGSIIIDNTGTLNVAGDATVSAASGGIALTAHSPLSVDGTVVTTSGAITLTAGATGVPGAGDTLTINGSVSSTSGNISLRAGDAINIAANAVVSTGGTVTQVANLNVPTIAQCTADPMLPGCSAVLPGLATCTADPATPGCTAVLPSLATCIASPTTA